MLAYFLTEYSPQSPKKELITIIREVAGRTYQSELVEEFIEARIDSVRNDLVTEFNTRNETDRPLRFAVVDPQATGEWICGATKAKSDKRIIFQDVLNKISPTDFEMLAAVVLKRLQCNSVFQTPQSHDQGVDAFGYKIIAPELSKAVTHKLVWVVQAKHYIKHPISTSTVRELVGTVEMLLCRKFSTVKERYTDLNLTPYGPNGLLLITTQAIPSTVRRLAEGAGIYVFEAADLYDIFTADLSKINTSSFLKLINDEVKDVPTLK